MSDLLNLASAHEMLGDFAARLDPAQLAAWLGATADMLQGVQAWQRRGVSRLRLMCSSDPN